LEKTVLTRLESRDMIPCSTTPPLAGFVGRTMQLFLLVAPRRGQTFAGLNIAPQHG
jgi:hypothetical protein